jgi:hypothetical protein
MTFGLSQRMLRWTFRRRNDFLTCVIDCARAGRGFQLAIVSEASSEVGRLERFRTAFDVLLRHASIVSDLRDSGWTLVAYTDSPRTPKQQSLTALAA